MEVSNFTVSLRIHHPSIKARDIADALPLEPYVVYSVGEQRVRPGGYIVEGIINHETYITYPLNTEGYDSIPLFIEDILKEPFMNDSIINEVIETGGRAMFYISIVCSENSGFSLEANLLTTLAANKISLGFDIYPEPEKSSEVDQDFNVF